MCTGLETAALIATVAGTAVSAYGQMAQGSAVKGASEYNAAISRNNAQISEWQAQDARERGEEEARRERLKTTNLIGKQKSALASNGIALDFGSPLELLVETAENGELDALTIEANAEREAYGHEVRASNYMANAGLEEYQGNQAYQSGLIGGGATILTGSGKLYNQYGGGSENMSSDRYSVTRSSVPVPSRKPARY